MKSKRICFKCGSNFVYPHVCVWNDEKIDAKCTAFNCYFAAATCRVHANTDNTSNELKDWLSRNSIKFVANSVFRNFPRVTPPETANSTQDDDYYEDFNEFINTIDRKSLKGCDTKAKYEEFKMQKQSKMSSDQKPEAYETMRNIQPGNVAGQNGKKVQKSFNSDNVNSTYSFTRYYANTINFPTMSANPFTNGEHLIDNYDIDETEEFFDAKDCPFNDENSQEENPEIGTSALEISLIDKATPPSNSPKAVLKNGDKINKVYSVFKSLMPAVLFLNLLLLLFGNGFFISLEYEGKSRPNLAVFKFSLKWGDSNEILEPNLHNSCCCRPPNLIHETDELLTSYLVNNARFKNDVKIKNVSHIVCIQNLKMTKMSVNERKCVNDESMIFDDDRKLKGDVKYPIDDTSEALDDISDEANENSYDWEESKFHINRINKSEKYEGMFDDDNEKSDDENKFDTKSRSQMRSSSHLYYGNYQVLESSYLLEGTTALLLRSRVGYVHPQMVMMTLMTSSTFQL